VRILCTGWDHFDAQEVGFKELYQMFILVTEQLGQDAIVLDADDLLKYPGETPKHRVYEFALSCFLNRDYAEAVVRKGGH
jgi:hypothetical protein